MQPDTSIFPETGRGTIYAVANQKGGVGKTTTCVNTAVCLAEAGATVLLVDTDPQCNATHGVGCGDDRFEFTIYDVLVNDVSVELAIVPTLTPQLFLLPSTPDLVGAEVELPLREKREYILSEALRPFSAKFDYVFIDCPPSLSLLTVNALVAADRLIIPVQCEYYALEGLGQLLRTFKAIKGSLNPRLAIDGLIMTMSDNRTNLASQVIEEVRSHFPNLIYKTVIPRNVRLSEAPSHGMPISSYDPTCAGSDAYFDLATEVVERE